MWFHKKRERQKLEEQLGDGFQWLANAMKAGLSFEQALEMAAQELDAPLNKIFANIVTKIKRGFSLEESLKEESLLLKSSDFTLFVSSVLLLKPLGGNFVLHFENLANILSDRRKISAKVRLYTTQGTTQGIFLALLPLMLGLALYFISPEWISLLWKTLMGLIFLAMIVLFDLLGWLWIQKIIHIQV